MKFLSFLASIFLCLPTLAIANLTSVPFGGVTLQLQSSSSQKDFEGLLFQVLTQTVKYLDSSFTSLLDDTEVEFSHIGLAVDTYDIDSNIGQNGVSFTFSGTAFFNSSPPPTTDDVLEMLAQSFLGKNSQRFTSTLMASNDPFLQRLSYAIVQVNGYVIPGGVMQGSDTAEEMTSNEEPFDLEQIALIVGCVFGTLLFSVLCYCFWCVGGDDDDDEQTEPRRKRTIPAARTSETEEDLEAASSPAPSSPQSIASQDSSVFTYNPQSRISFDASTLSTHTADPNNLDLATWQQKNIINSSRYAPFGHDISAIEMLNENKKDLSLIEEGDESATPIKSALSKEYLSKRERRERSQSRNVEYLSKRERRERTQSRDVSIQSEQSDVIADLRNLSQQINHHRRR